MFNLQKNDLGVLKISYICVGQMTYKNVLLYAFISLAIYFSNFIHNELFNKFDVGVTVTIMSD
jgi:hypothetical protein